MAPSAATRKHSTAETELVSLISKGSHHHEYEDDSHVAAKDTTMSPRTKHAAALPGNRRRRVIENGNS